MQDLVGLPGTSLQKYFCLFIIAYAVFPADWGFLVAAPFLVLVWFH